MDLGQMICGDSLYLQALSEPPVTEIFPYKWDFQASVPDLRAAARIHLSPQKIQCNCKKIQCNCFF
jgi:hypothetical protein